jgi:hypothetical protein
VTDAAIEKLLQLLTAGFGTKPPKGNATACPQLAKADVASPAHALVNPPKSA